MAGPLLSEASARRCSFGGVAAAVQGDEEEATDALLADERSDQGPERSQPRLAQWRRETLAALSATALLAAASRLLAARAPAAGGQATAFIQEAEKDWPPVHELYMYRAASDGEMSQYPFGNINTANVDGLLWYLLNEVVTEYTNGTRCPRKFNISKIHRFRVRTRATSALYLAGMNFGTRFAFDMGKCMGRCFADNLCTGHADCATEYARFGHVVGCNNFKDKFPFPDFNTSMPGGIWYSLPLDGRCDGLPTGTPHCTWSYEDAGTVTLEDLEALAPGTDNCCGGGSVNCTDFYKDQFWDEANEWRINETLNLFAEKYSHLPRNLEVPCDFDREAVYAYDPWPRVDPWAKSKEKAQHRHYR